MKVATINNGNMGLSMNSGFFKLNWKNGVWFVICDSIGGMPITTQTKSINTGKQIQVFEVVFLKSNVFLVALPSEKNLKATKHNPFFSCEHDMNKR